MKMENNSNEGFTLTEEQIRFIDDEFLNKGRKLEYVVTKLVRRNDNNFQKKDVEQIKELYIKIKRQKTKPQYKWTQKELKKLENILEKEIEEKGEDINLINLAEELEKTGLFGPHNKRSIANKLYELANKSKAYRQFKPRKNRSSWIKEDEEKLEKVLKKAIKEKGEDINIVDLAKSQAELLKFYSVEAITAKMYALIDKLPEYRQIRQKKQIISKWSPEEKEILTRTRKENKEKGKNISNKGLAEELQKGPLKNRSKEAIRSKMRRLERQSEYAQEKNKITENAGAENNNCMSVDSQNNNEINEYLAKELKEAIDQCFKDTKQLNNAENHLVKINTLEKNKSDNSYTPDHNSFSNIMSDLFPNEPSSNEHSM